MDEWLSKKEHYFYKEMRSPTGPLRLIATNTHLVGVQWRLTEHSIQGENFLEAGQHALLLETERQLEDYFSGKRRAFDVPVALDGSEFQKKVWERLPEIPFGTTITYGEMARRLGDIKMVRAVGGALNKNPVPIIVPCHRVIGSGGKMVGFGGGMQNKIYLLNLENPKPQLDLW